MSGTPNIARVQAIVSARLLESPLLPVCFMVSTNTIEHKKIILDTGASHHMFCDAALLTNIYARASSVLLGGSKGHKVTSEWRGNAGYLEDVMIVPALKKNLIAAFALTAKGLTISLEGPKCFVHDASGRVISEGSVGADRLYTMDRNLLNARPDIGYEVHLTEIQKQLRTIRTLQKQHKYHLTGQATTRRLTTMRSGLNPLNVLRPQLPRPPI